MASDTPSVTLTAHCLCKAHTFTTQVPASKLPLPVTACHCDSCRHVTGALYSIDTQWPAPRSSVDTSALNRYAFSSRIHVLFCGTCSTPMFFDHQQNSKEELGVFTGALKNDEGDLVRLTNHIFVGDTIDGGSTMWLRRPNADGTEAKRFKNTSRGDKVEEYTFDWPPVESLTRYEAKKENSLPIRCKCKGIDFVLYRGNYTDKKREELPWFIDPTTHKLLGGFCACDSCRLSSGIDIFNWTYAGLENISYPESTSEAGPAFPNSTSELKALVDAKDPRMGTLAYYSSSPDVQRYFCSNCSACVFYAVDDRPEIVDVAIGVLESSDGARAEDFVSWAFGKVGSSEDTKGGWREPFIQRVEEECEQWREKRGYPKNWRRIEREAAEAKGNTYY